MALRRFTGALWLIAVLLLTITSCTGSDGGSGGRVIAVHNALQSIGFSQMGEVSEGMLEEGRSQQFTFDFEEDDCYVFVAFGSQGVRDLNIELISPDGEQVAADETTDRQSVLQVCADSAGEYTLNLTMAGGQGSYTLAHWSGGELDMATGSGARREPEGSCGRPIALEMGTTVSGSTASALDLSSARCVPGAAPDVAYEFTLENRANVCIDMTSTYDGALVLQTECGQPHSEIACNDDSVDTRHSALRETLEAGTYYLLATGFGEARGNYSLTTALAETPEPAELCRQAQALTPGQAVQGTTAGCLADAFQATCAAGARSPEKVYSLNISKRSRVRIESSSTSHDGALYLRSNCTDAASEIVCNDDYRDTRHSLLTATLDPGTYYVFADGYGENQQGAFTLRAQVSPLSGTPVPGDACSSAQPLTPGTVSGSTISANASFTGSCSSSQDSPDLVYALNLTERSRVRARIVNSDMRAALYIQSTCGQQSSEIACEAAGPRFGLPSIERVLDAGTYYLVVDGLDQNEFGDFELAVEVTSTRGLEQQCRTAPLLRPQTPTTGVTSGSDEFHASCAGGARSPENIYRLQLARRQLVRLSLESNYDAALYIRRTCLDESTEVACNDDHQDTRHSLIETTLDRGTYYVFVDGFSTGNQGQYTINLELRNP
jgi:hypothetical protein